MDLLTCKEVILEYLAEYLEATLSPERVADLERHLKACAPCVAYLKTYQKTRDLTQQTMRVSMPEEMKAHLRQFLLEHHDRA